MNVAGMTIPGLLRRNAENCPDKPAVIAPGYAITYGELDRQVTDVARGLVDLGLARGDRVAIMFLNDPHFLVAYFAVLRAGGIVVPINTRLVADEVAYQVRHSESRMILHGEGFVDLVDEVARTHAFAVRVSTTSREAGAILALSEVEARGHAFETALPLVAHEDPAGIWYTSGTTGIPKGALSSHASSIWSAVGMALTGRITSDSRVLAPAPLFHRGPMETLGLAGFLVGATHYLMAQFDPTTLLETIERHAMTHAFIVPAMTFAVLNLDTRGDYDLTSMECWLTASAHFPEEHRNRLEAETTLRQNRIYNAYGITESLLNTCLDPLSLEGHRGSVGSPVPGTMIRIVGSDRQPLLAGEVGEIAVSGASIALGYVGNEDAWNAVTFTDGGLTWYLSGDLGYRDPDGFLYIVDRAKDMVISGGENVYSAEVERVLASHPAISEVAVVGIPDQRWGECVTAVVAVRSGFELDRASLDDFCEGKLAPYKRPRLLFRIEALPRNAFGKVRKNAVREFVRSSASQHERDAAEAAR